jgi:hypothetical protein
VLSSSPAQFLKVSRQCNLDPVLVAPVLQTSHQPSKTVQHSFPVQQQSPYGTTQRFIRHWGNVSRVYGGQCMGRVLEV